jgi:hypothetical protein
MTPEVAERARENPQEEGTRMLPAYLDYTGLTSWGRVAVIFALWAT